MEENLNNIEEQQVAEAPELTEGQDVQENVVEEEPQNPARVLIALTKNRGGKKVLAESMEGYESGYTVEGIFIEKDGIARLVSINESQARFGINSQDLKPGDAHYGVIEPNLGDYDGEEMTQLLIDIYYLQAGDAAVEAQAYGWLPEAGEMDLVMDNLEAFNALVEALGGTPITNGKYWLSQRRNANYAWFYDAAEKGCGSWIGGMSSLSIRPFKSAEDWL